MAGFPTLRKPSNWQVDPTTYGGSTTFDVTVTWQVDMAFSQAFVVANSWIAVITLTAVPPAL